MKTILTVTLLMISTLSFSHGEANHQAISVSIVQLISSPEKYHNKVVRIIGASQVEFEGNLVCLIKEHLQHGITKNCLWHSVNYEQIMVSPSILSKYNGKYVLMEGTFNMSNTGHMGMAGGALENVTRYQLWEQ